MPDKRKKDADLQKEIKSLRLRVAELEKDELRYSHMGAPPKSDLLYQTLMENIHLGISFIDTDRKIITTNVCMGRFFRKPHSEFVGKYCFREFEKRSAVCSHCPGTRAMATGHPATAETEGVLDDGSRMSVRIQAFPVFEADGSIKGFIEVIEDITEHKQVEEKLRESEIKIRAIFDQTFQFIGLMNIDGTLIEANRTALEFSGIDSSSVLNKPFWQGPWWTHSHELQEKLRQSVEKAARGEFIRFEATHVAKDGMLHYIDFSLKPVKDETGKVIFLIPEGRDITERRKAEEELNTYREKMVRAERLASLGTLSATLAHELTQPLTVIRLSIENSLEDLEAASCPKAVIKGLKDSLNEVSNATSVVERFRNFARQSSRKTLCETDLGAIADRIVRLLGKTAQRAKMALHLKSMDKLPPVYSNEKDIEQLFFALTENAIQAADGKKNHRLAIEGAVKGKNIELRFSDNCSGIAPENLDKIFDPFFTTASDDGRTGLGLPIVQRILSEYEGKIRVQSRLGKGTTFYVTLPIHSEIVK